MGFLIALIAMVLVFCLMLPIISIIYFDTLAVQKESKAQIDRMERLRKQLEDERKKMDQANRKEDQR
jgi:acid phosphatase family membrane protein YuiD